MDKNRIIRYRKWGKKTIAISIRITPEIASWLRHNNYSPTAIFYEAIKDLGFKEE